MKLNTHSSDTCPAVREVQADLLGDVIAICEELGLGIILADPVSKVEPVYWIIGEQERQRELITKCASLHIRSAPSAQSSRAPKRSESLNNDLGNLVLWKKYVIDGYVAHGRSSGIVVDFCTFDETNGTWLPCFPCAEIEVSPSYLAHPRKAEFLGRMLPTLGNAVELLAQSEALGKIDVVYTWVDGNDAAWRERKSHFQQSDAVPEDDGSVRYVSHKELLYSIRSVKRYFADLGKIYIVTDQQVPLLLGSLLNDVVIVDHKSIFPDHGKLPSFNSHAIGANLHRIEGLSERYLYLNDDVLLGRPVSKSKFFDELGRGYQFRSRRIFLPFSAASDEEPVVLAAARNARHLLKEKFGYHAFQRFKHTPIPTIKSVMQDMEVDLPEAWLQTLENRSRSKADFPIAGFLYFHYAYIKGKSIIGKIEYNYFDLSKPDFDDIFSRSSWKDASGRPEVYCLAATRHDDHFYNQMAVVEETLDKVYSSNPSIVASISEAGTCDTSIGVKKSHGGGCKGFLRRKWDWLRGTCCKDSKITPDQSAADRASPPGLSNPRQLHPHE
jgi:hypothetical protein